MDVQALLDPEIAAVLPPSPADWSRLAVADVPRVRPEQAQLAVGIEVPLSDEVTRTDHTAAEGVVVRVHRAKTSAGRRPCVYWIHGGGYIMGSYTCDDLRMDHWCPRFDCVGVSVDYRLAPEHPYPAAGRLSRRAEMAVRERRRTRGRPFPHRRRGRERRRRTGGGTRTACP